MCIRDRPTYRPLWKFWLLPDAEGGAVLLLRMHHCYADGLSLQGIFDRLCPPSPQQAPVLYGAAEQADMGRWGRAANAWLRELTASEWPREEAGAEDDIPRNGGTAGRNALERATWKSVKLVNELSQFLVEPEDTDSSLKRSLLGRRQCRWSQPVALERFRRIATLTSVTINDVLLSCVASAVRNRLVADDTDMDEAVLHAAVPVDIRNRLPEGVKPEPGTLGNYFGTVSYTHLTLPTTPYV